jgi:hypothetical protein
MNKTRIKYGNKRKKSIKEYKPKIAKIKICEHKAKKNYSGEVNETPRNNREEDRKMPFYVYTTTEKKRNIGKRFSVKV